MQWEWIAGWAWESVNFGSVEKHPHYLGQLFTFSFLWMIAKLLLSVIEEKIWYMTVVWFSCKDKIDVQISMRITSNYSARQWGQKHKIISLVLCLTNITLIRRKQWFVCTSCAFAPGNHKPLNWPVHQEKRKLN